MSVSARENGYLATVARMIIVLTMVTAASATPASAEDGGSDAQALKKVERELRQLRADRARDRKLIEKLELNLTTCGPKTAISARPTSNSRTPLRNCKPVTRSCRPGQIGS